jgi:orotidine-5'-phosphate decarboxylase
VTDTFAARFAKVRSDLGPVVWGLDPSRAVLQAWELGDDPGGLDRFADIVLEAAAGTVGLVKPQSAFFERQCWRDPGGLYLTRGGLGRAGHPGRRRAVAALRAAATVQDVAAQALL